MAWDFQTEPEFQSKLDWADAFIRTEVEPLDVALGAPADKSDLRASKVLGPLQGKVKSEGLWACHLGPDLGGQGFGQVKLALLNELLGRSRWAPWVFGCQAPDSGNAEALASYGTERQKAQYLKPLLNGEISSAFSMTEPHAGADPTLFTTSAVKDGEEWVINGEKWFTTFARYSTFLLVLAVTNPEAAPHRRMSMFLVPTNTPGVKIIRNLGVLGDPAEVHGYVRYEDVRVPTDHLLGAEGEGFSVAQTRLGGGRLHHAMRTVGRAQQALDMMCERAVSRTTRQGNLGSFQMVQERLADSWIELQQFRLLVLHTAWVLDQHHDYKAARKDIAAVKVVMPRVLHDIAQRALHLHGSLGASQEMPFAAMLIQAETLGIIDGPTEVHKVTIARDLLSRTEPTTGRWPSGHIPSLREAALVRLGFDAETQEI